MRGCGASAALPSVNLLAISVVYQNGVFLVSLELVQRNIDEYHGVHSDPNEASRDTGANSVNLEELLCQEMLSDQAADKEDVIGKALSSARRLI